MKFNSVNTNDNLVDLISLRHNSYFGFMVLHGWLVNPYNGLSVSWAV